MSDLTKHPAIEYMARNPERVDAHLPENWTPETAKRNMLAILQADQTSGGKIARCTPQSLLLCVLRAGSLGLSFDSGDIYVIPYGDTATLSISYRGLITLAKRSGEIHMLRAEVVYAGETFAFNNSSDPSRRGFDHPISIPRSTGEIVAAYVCIDRRDGLTDFEVMDRAEIDQVREVSKASNGPAWSQWFGEMAKKAVIRRALKRYTLQPELHDVFAAEDAMSAHATVVGGAVRAVASSSINARLGLVDASDDAAAAPAPAQPRQQKAAPKAQKQQSAAPTKAKPAPQQEVLAEPAEDASVMQSIGQLMRHAEVADDVREAARAFIARLGPEGQEEWQIALKEADDRAQVVREAAKKGGADVAV